MCCNLFQSWWCYTDDDHDDDAQPTSIVSYNHLGNNDGMNLSAPQTFRSKEISKSNVVDDMVASNGILYEPGEHPDHVVVIKVIELVVVKWALFLFVLKALSEILWETTVHICWSDISVCWLFNLCDVVCTICGG